MSGACLIPRRLLNPSRLHLQKLALHLKCPICLNLLNRPMLLPCNHILCNVCIPKLSQYGSKCQLCEQHYASQDVRPAPYMENIVTIYRSLDATFKTNLLQLLMPDADKVPEGSPVSFNVNVAHELKEPSGSPPEGNSSNGQSTFSLTANKRVRASLNCSLDEEKKSTRKSGFGVDEREAIHVILSSPSPSIDDSKGIDGNCSCPGSSNYVGLERKQEVHSGEDCFPDLKRQKISDDRLFDPCSTCNESQLDGSCSERTGTSKSESRPGECYGVETLQNLDPFGKNKSICAFCQSSEITDRTGLMLHYLHGKEVVGDAAMNSNAIHVHKICVEWTPQAYFVEETVKNLDGEISRAAKLKCSHCGIKGAALGCFMKTCRRTYHVPCAVEISECRWDTDEFLLLCPMHSKVKFPGEKSKSGKRAREKQQCVPAAITSKKSGSIEVPNADKNLLFCGSALSSEEKYQLVKFASCCGAAVTKFWDPNVTHVIASTDSNGAYIRTLKVLKAILHGRWILKTDWVKASMEAMQPVNEEPYEVYRDKYGCCDGPKMGRLRVLENAPKLFDGMNFYFFGDFVPGYKNDLLDLVITAGGTVLKSKEEMVAQKNATQINPTLVVYNSDLMLEEEDLAGEDKIEAAKSFARVIGCKFIGHTWLLESIASCNMKPFWLVNGFCQKFWF